MMQTIGYKTGYIHLSYFGNNNENEMVKVQVDRFAYPIIVKSLHAAKILISKHVRASKMDNVNITEYEIELLNRTGWTLEFLREVLRRLELKEYSPIDHDYYLSKISPF